MSQRTALIMAGGTGGHIFPGLAIAEALRARSWRVEWLGTSGGMEKALVLKSGIPFHTTDFEGVVGRGWIARLRMPFKLLAALARAGRVLSRVNPSVVIGMGGYPALPGGLMSAWTKRLLITHEQNAVPGQTNRVLASRATKILCAFPETYKTLGLNAVVVGNPVRRDILDAASARNDWDGSRTLRIAVVGGSRGALALNELLPAALALLPAERRPSIIHQTGKGNAQSVQFAYHQRGIAADVREFVDDMAMLYRDVDLFICRSGASTVSELACAQMPSVLVPYPFHADQQQLHNARFLTNAGGAWLMEQNTLNAETLAHHLEHITPAQLATMRSILKSNAHPDATQRIVDIIESQGSVR